MLWYLVVVSGCWGGLGGVVLVLVFGCVVWWWWVVCILGLGIGLVGLGFRCVVVVSLWVCGLCFFR